MGEAKRRGSRPPTTIERARRSAVDFWNIYPKWFRDFYLFNAKVVLAGVVFVALAAALLGVAALFERIVSR